MQPVKPLPIRSRWVSGAFANCDGIWPDSWLFTRLRPHNFGRASQVGMPPLSSLLLRSRRRSSRSLLRSGMAPDSSLSYRARFSSGFWLPWAVRPPRVVGMLPDKLLMCSCRVFQIGQVPLQRCRNRSSEPGTIAIAAVLPVGVKDQGRQVGEISELRRKGTRELVVGEVECPQLRKVSHSSGNGAADVGLADIQGSQLGEAPYLRRDRSAEVVPR